MINLKALVSKMLISKKNMIFIVNIDKYKYPHYTTF